MIFIYVDTNYYIIYYLFIIIYYIFMINHLII